MIHNPTSLSRCTNIKPLIPLSRLDVIAIHRLWRRVDKGKWPETLCGQWDKGKWETFIRILDNPFLWVREFCDCGGNWLKPFWRFFFLFLFSYLFFFIVFFSFFFSLFSWSFHKNWVVCGSRWWKKGEG